MLRSGVESVRIDRLARDLKATKGSFYWHFKDRAALLKAVLERWESITLELNALLDTQEPDPARRLLRLFHLPDESRPAHVSNYEFEQAVHNWSSHSTEVARVVRRVERVREQNHTRMFEQLGVAKERALVLARISGGIAGRLWATTRWSPAEREAFVREAYSMLMQAVGVSAKDLRREGERHKSADLPAAIRAE